MRRIPSIHLRSVPARSRRGRRLRIATVAAVGAALAIPVSASAANDQFLQLSGNQYKGESLAEGFRDAIEVQSASFNVKRASRTAVAPTFGNLSVTKRVDRSSPALMLAAASGTKIPSARLSVRMAGQDMTKPYLEYCFEDVVVISDAVANSSGDDAPQEAVTLSYQKLTQAYGQPISNGMLREPIVAGWSLIANGSISGFPATCGE
jgi:type VI secretion system secreted protein Hcp